jgi:hypothetical protein
VDELRPGLWTWTGRHPGWTPDEKHWGPDVRSYAFVRDDRVLLFDPIDPPDAFLAGRTAEIVLTAEWLHPLLELPVELLLPTHGDPIVEDAHAHLERALGSR